MKNSQIIPFKSSLPSQSKSSLPKLAVRNGQGTKVPNSDLSVDDIAKLENIGTRAIRKQIKNGKYPNAYQVESTKGGRGGLEWRIPLRDCSAEVQKAYIESLTDLQCVDLIEVVKELSAEGQRAWKDKTMPTPPFVPPLDRGGNVNGNVIPFTSEMTTRHSLEAFSDPRAKRISEAVRKASIAPPGMPRAIWKEAIAKQYGVSLSTLYKWEMWMKSEGVCRLKHTRNTKGTFRAFEPEAVRLLCGTYLKCHRDMSIEAVYKQFKQNALAKGLKIGSFQSARRILTKNITPHLEAYKNGGIRALDNLLTPIIRDHSDLHPFQILVGDQQIEDFPVIDDETGLVFRPQSYKWQDLRTRWIFGYSVGVRYNKYMMGLALRMGVYAYGISSEDDRFFALYNDHGKPELSNYIKGVLSQLEHYLKCSEITPLAPLDRGECAGIPLTGGDVHTGGEIEAPNIYLDDDDDEAADLYDVNVKQILAITRNAKAKMIESTNRGIKQVLLNHGMPCVPKLGDTQEYREEDKAKLEALRDEGKLPTLSEFAKVYAYAVRYYNTEKPHKGVLKEWIWKPKPASVTPYECLRACFDNGWRPVRFDSRDIDIMFLAESERNPHKVDKGIIRFKMPNGNTTEWINDEGLLLTHEGEYVSVRYDHQFSPHQIWLFNESGKFICHAFPMVYGSMRNEELTKNKIEEKRSKRKGLVQMFRYYTKGVEFLKPQIPDMEVEKIVMVTHPPAPSLSDREGEAHVLTAAELTEKVEEEAAAVKQFEEEHALKIREGLASLPDTDRYDKLMEMEVKGIDLTADERAFMKYFEGTDLYKNFKDYYENQRTILAGEYAN